MSKNMYNQFKKVIDEFIKKIKEKFGDRIESIVLFGSYATGEYREDSDIDVLIIGDLKIDDVISVAYPIFLKYGVYISPIVMGREHFEMLKSEKTGFIENILRRGVVLYGRE